MHVRSVSLFTIAIGIAFFSLPARAQTAPREKLWPTISDLVAGKDTDADPAEPTIDIYLPPADKATGAAVLILPGGGYVNLSTLREGLAPAQLFQSHNIAAFVVRYRHAPRYHYPDPILDAQRAVRIVRSRAAQYHIDPARIGIMGFSAGGHLAATLATQSDTLQPNASDPIDAVSSRPDFAILLYPVITFTDEPNVHKGSRTALVGNDQKLWTDLSAELHVTKNTPPTFIVQGSADRTVPPPNAINFYLACLKNGVPAELHLLQTGTHGFGLAPTDPRLNHWPEFMFNWMLTNKWIPPEAAATTRPAQ